MQQITRKALRLPDYDYTQQGIYFVTCCVKGRMNLFWDVGARIARPPDRTVPLNRFGKIVESAILDIPAHYPDICVDHYAVMPNHIHLLLRFSRTPGTASLSTVIGQCKGIVTKQMRFSPWQKGFYDHIVRNQADYNRIWEYIDKNPEQWNLDRFYVPFMDMP